MIRVKTAGMKVGGFAKGRRLGDSERGAWIPLHRPKLSGPFNTLVIWLNSFLSWDLRALALAWKSSSSVN